MDNSRSVIFIAPHWNTPGYVGNLRAVRMIRWLNEEGYRVTLIRAGLSDRRETAAFGEIITIRDPLSMYADKPEEEGSGEKVVQVTRKPNAFRRWLSYVLLIPDPGIVWARRAMRHPLVLEACPENAWYMASSPPESGFIVASHLAGRFSGRFIMDMRDGWLDEPIKPLLRTSRLQRLREKRLEQKMVQSACSILVTSHHWKKQLIARYPDAEAKTNVITNAYPVGAKYVESNNLTNIIEDDRSTKRIRFLYAGRIFSSGPGRNIGHLLDPMLAFARSDDAHAEIIFLGDLIPEEEDALNQWKMRFKEEGWEITRHSGMSHDNAVALMHKVDVLLLLSASRSAIPAKFFDYISAGKPVFAAYPAKSSVAEAGKEITQLYGYAFEEQDTAPALFRRLMKDLKDETISVSRPEEFEESSLKPKFITLFQK